MEKKASILIVTSEFPPQPGGIGTHAYNVARHLALQDYYVEVLCDQRSEFGNEESVFDDRLGFKVHRIALKSFRPFMYVKRLLLLLRLQKHTDVILASGKFSLWSVAICSLFFKKRYIGVIHGTEVNFKQPLLRYSIRRALHLFDQLIAVSHYTKSLIADIPIPIVVIPNGYDVQKWDIGIVASQSLQGQPKLVTVGNVTERKGQQHVIAHLPNLILHYPNIHYHCIGIPTQKEAFLKLVKVLGVEGYVTFHGRLSDAELQAYLLACDVMIMLSSVTTTGDVEGFGIAIIESNALGIPCIGSKDCGIEDAIKDHHSGVLIPFDDTQGFLAALAEIFAHKEHYALAARSWAQQHEWTSVINRYQDVIDL